MKKSAFPVETSFFELGQKYDGFLIDLWGVVHDGYKLYPGILEALNTLQSLDKGILFLSNAPRPATIIMKKLIELGLKVTQEMVLTSGDLVRDQLIHFNDTVFSHLGKKFYHLGADRNIDLTEGLLVQTVPDLNQANFILSSAYIDEDEDLKQFDTLLQQGVQLNLPFICANPDKDILNGSKIRYCSGVLADKYELLGGKAYYYGKPYPAIFKEAFKRLDKKGVYKDKIIMIGDTLETDIAGAVNADIDSALVLQGNTRLLLEKAKAEDPNLDPLSFLQQIFQAYAIAPTWLLK